MITLIRKIINYFLKPKFEYNYQPELIAIEERMNKQLEIIKKELDADYKSLGISLNEHLDRISKGQDDYRVRQNEQSEKQHDGNVIRHEAHARTVEGYLATLNKLVECLVSKKI